MRYFLTHLFISVIISLHWWVAPPAGHRVRPGAGAPGALKHRGNPDIHDLSCNKSQKKQMHV